MNDSINVQIFDDHIDIDARKNAKEMFYALLLISPLCLIDWILVWTGLAEPDEPKITSGFVIILLIISFFGVAVEATIKFRFDKDGATRTVFKKYVVFIPWDEMKYIGVCQAARDYPSGIPPKMILLCSKLPLSKYKRFHPFIIDRWIESKKVITMGLQQIDDEIVEKILEFSGGERNIP